MAADRQGRRGFFREFLKRVVDPAASYAEKHLPAPQSRLLLRPPGALSERPFLDACYRCGNCADVCPVDAISHYQGDEETLKGTPFINPETQPCVACDGLLCMHSCPSGALVTTPLEQIRMGLAHLDQETCLRGDEQDCRHCIEVCPTTEKALRVNAQGLIEVISQNCIGCGLCQEACPTTPRAIVVQPI
ncbi:MAG: ferredoxin-type protein NapG [Candidatus Latescibacterota bacterium]|jgi:ferredoxin-type protein NapG